MPPRRRRRRRNPMHAPRRTTLKDFSQEKFTKIGDWSGVPEDVRIKLLEKATHPDVFWVDNNDDHRSPGAVRNLRVPHRRGPVLHLVRFGTCRQVTLRWLRSSTAVPRQVLFALRAPPLAHADGIAAPRRPRESSTPPR
jgi:hypothetical protein